MRCVSTGVFEVGVVGPSSVGDAYANVETTGVGTFKVSIHPGWGDDVSDRAFTVVAI